MSLSELYKSYYGLCIVGNRYRNIINISSRRFVHKKRQNRQKKKNKRHKHTHTHIQRKVSTYVLTTVTQNDRTATITSLSSLLLTWRCQEITSNVWIVVLPTKKVSKHSTFSQFPFIRSGIKQFVQVNIISRQGPFVVLKCSV